MWWLWCSPRWWMPPLGTTINSTASALPLLWKGQHPKHFTNWNSWKSFSLLYSSLRQFFSTCLTIHPVGILLLTLLKLKFGNDHETQHSNPPDCLSCLYRWWWHFPLYCRYSHLQWCSLWDMWSTQDWRSISTLLWMIWKEWNLWITKQLSLTTWK